MFFLFGSRIFRSLPRNMRWISTSTLQKSQVDSSFFVEGPMPYRVSLGLLKVTLVSIPSMYVGAIAAKRGAEFLEEWNIFVPDDEDD